MFIVTQSEKRQYELANIWRIFFPQERIEYGASASDCEDVIVEPTQTEEVFALSMRMPDGREFSRKFLSGSCSEVVADHIVYGRMLYDILVEFCGKEAEWGVLTGIRPVKLAKKLRLAGKSPQDIAKYFVEEYKVSAKKAELVVQTDQVQSAVAADVCEKDFSLYVSIPFCPSRCSYCSFVSHSIENTMKLIPDYLDRLCEEIAVTGEIAKREGLVLRSIYIGGGTPTVLSEEQLERLISQIDASFDRSQCLEFTVEAGRPDTILPKKMQVLKNHEVTRVTVNCQTLNDDVLREIGRAHSAKDFEAAYELVRSFGFEVNVDLIAGLPTEDFASFRRTVERIVELAPENITLHTLTVKRSARLKEQCEDILNFEPTEESVTAQMVDFGQAELAQNGYLPYYLYRQKGTVDSLENVGYCRGDSICEYNVWIMDEEQTILSTGAGGVTKVVGSEISRVFNFKYPYEYIDKFDVMLERKRGLFECD